MKIASSDAIPTKAPALPGAPAPVAGNNWSAGPHDDLLLPSGERIGDSNNESVRAELACVGVASAHSDGRLVIVQRYAALLKKVHDDAGKAAVAEYLQKHRI